MRVGRRRVHEFAEAAIPMHTDHLEVAADIAAPGEARMAFATTDHRIDGNELTDSRVVHAFANAIDPPDEFVADHAWVDHKRILAVQDVDVRAADARVTDAHTHFTCRWFHLRPLKDRHPVRLFNDDAQHV